MTARPQLDERDPLPEPAHLLSLGATAGPGSRRRCRDGCAGEAHEAEGGGGVSGCHTCGGYGMRHDPIAHGWVQEGEQCWAMADDENPDCPIGSARCVRPTGHDDEHVWEAAP